MTELNQYQLNIEGISFQNNRVFVDERGSFEKIYSSNVINLDFKGCKEINFVKNPRKGVIRGLHFQQGNFGETKILKVIKGSIKDVVIDLRVHSKTFGDIFSCELEVNSPSIVIPKGLAHGYQVLENDTELIYYTDMNYAPGNELGVNPNSIELLNVWEKIPLLISEKDSKLPHLKEYIK